VLAALEAQIRLGCTQVVPVRLRLDATPVHRNELALDAEQPLNDALGSLVAPFAKMMVADDAVGVDEVDRRPVSVVEGPPDRVVVIDGDRVVDPSLLDRLTHQVDLVLEGELRRVDSDHDQPILSVRL
jgi:hypothetical protein